ncbi:MAG TPA: Asd/ArgC dimerization domain-containing protein [Thermoanaerobaculia bacterium]|nr:Asd/ArgC dimerization domain-containing protein [Thermoanaerobaculia bacterium]
MRRIAIVNPTNLLGKELREEIERRPGLFGHLELLATDEDEIGRLTESYGSAAMVRRLEPGDLDDLDTVFLLGPAATWRPLLTELSTGVTAIVVSREAEATDGPPVVAGVNSWAAAGSSVLVSPHAGVVLLAQLIGALSPLPLLAASATVMQPASVFGEEGMDELFEQTRAILTFSQERPEAVFGRQLAFNLYPAEPAADLKGDLAAVLGEHAPQLSVLLLQGGFFHGVAASVHLTFANDPGLPAIREALGRAPRVAVEDRDEVASPVEAANSGEILVGALRAEGGGRYWLWAVMDNLTLGTAKNAADLAEGLGSAATH